MSRSLVLCLCLSLGLVACGEPAPVGFRNTDISGGVFGDSLVGFRDQRGRETTLTDFKGKTVILFFGYTSCPDVCPTILARLSTVMRKLGADAERIQVLMVTVDPEHDTPDRLAAYMAGFNPSFIGLYNDHPATEAAAKVFKVFYSPAAANPVMHVAHDHAQASAPVQIDHSAGSYVFDSRGNIRLYIKDDAAVDAIVGDLKWLLAER